MGKPDDSPHNSTPVASKPSPNPKDSQASSSHRPNNGDGGGDNSPLPNKQPQSPREFIISVAANIASQPLQCSNPDVWGVLTAISQNARQRRQVHHPYFAFTEFLEQCVSRRLRIGFTCIGGEGSCLLGTEGLGTLGRYSPGLREYVGGVKSRFQSVQCTNGTYLNWEKLNKNSPESKLQHGDIVSFAAPPQHEIAYAFVYRKVLKSTSLTDGSPLKRKAAPRLGCESSSWCLGASCVEGSAQKTYTVMCCCLEEEAGSESKRVRGIGIGASEGPISLDDFRSLQRSNMELRKQLENQVSTTDRLCNENRVAIERHEIEKKDLKESISKSYLDQLKELQRLLEAKEKELLEVNKISAEQKHALEDLNERLSASMQSCTEANEIINSQKTSISELKALIDEERDQRREEREKAAGDLKASVQRVQAEAQEELKRVSDAASRREKEQQEVINKLQESEKERCSLVEVLRSKLEDTRQKLVISDNKVRQLEAQTCELQLASANGIKRVEELEHEARKLRKALESEKQAAREEAWAKVSVLELEVNAAMRDLDFERRRLKGARERIMLRETQLRAFYSTTEEISALFAKQQEQLKAMQKTLEDQENYDNISVDMDINQNSANVNGPLVRGKEVVGYQSYSVTKAGSRISAHNRVLNQVEISSDEASVTEKHDCDIRNHEDGQDTQEGEFTSGDRLVKGGFGSDIYGVGTAPVLEGDPVGTESAFETEGLGDRNIDLNRVGTERVYETESPGLDGDQNIDLNKVGTERVFETEDQNVESSKFNALAGDTMQVDGEPHSQEVEVQQVRISPHHSESDIRNVMEDTEAGGTVKTADLLASEVAGSWACSTAPSVHGENESPRSRDNDEDGVAALHESNGPVAESQSAPSSNAVAARRNHERQALSEMIGIVAPDLKEQFGGCVGSDCDEEGGEKGLVSNSETEDCTDNDDNNVVNSDAETLGSDQENEGRRSGVAMSEDDEATQEDSLG
ncbi:hypothetical protein RJ639_031747 [Escallonia herrerae]|uniref:Uncharacterized protein n=1 Tax=Escallonia herrerae TaxID=1293975 RepID=A0AA88X650_9ASTE|nr:hypothetical protein RJ639_031747 [Escallonia herrerae]